MAKTTFHHNDAGFEKAMFGLLGSKPQLQSLVSKKTSLLPAKLNVPPGPPLSEDEMLRLAFQQYMKFSASGTA